MTDIEQKIEAWKAAHPRHLAAYQWIVVNLEENDFAASLAAGMLKWGGLTIGQTDAVHRILARDAGKEVRMPIEIDASKIEAAMSRARLAGIKHPRLRVGDVRLTGSRKSPSAIYAKTADGIYLGTALDGKFKPSALCSENQVEVIREIFADPAAAAVNHGRRFGQCACCGKELSDAESVARGIGPVCAVKFGFN